MKRPLLAVALIYGAGVVIGDRSSVPFSWLVTLSLAMSVASLAFERVRRYLLWPLILMAGWANLAGHTEIRSPHDLRTSVGTNVAIVRVRGTLVETPGERVLKRGSKETSANDGEAARHRARDESDLAAGVGSGSPVTTRGVLPASFFTGRDRRDRGRDPSAQSTRGGRVV